MLILIENEPRDYAWGSKAALAELLGKPPTETPQAELWMGVHPQSPSRIAKASPEQATLLDLVTNSPEKYGVDGGPLPFLLKVLAIDSPLSLQVHPSVEQAEEGFAQEDAAGITLGAPERNYRDRNHKPELLVALSKVEALSGFRPLEDALTELRALADALADGPGKDALLACASLCRGSSQTARAAVLQWALAPNSPARHAVPAIGNALVEGIPGISELRLRALRRLCDEYPNDPGVLVSLLLHVVELEPGQAIYLPSGQLHAYLHGLAIEVMASSDNVLRGGLTAKHIDTNELTRITNFDELASPRLAHREVEPGLIAWEPEVADFRLLRASVSSPAQAATSDRQDAAQRVSVAAEYPLTLIVTEGRIEIERAEEGISEIARLRRGQALYVSAGAPISIEGDGQVYLATVGRSWGER